MIPSLDAIEAINRERGGALVISTPTPTTYWESVSTKPDLDVPILNAMGKTSSVALGIALACPYKKVVALDGDGALLMNLGSLVTIADQRPENLVHFVFEDGVYFTTGGQPIPGAGRFDLAAMARGGGIKASYGFDNLEDFVSELPDIMTRKGPVFVCLRVNHAEDLPEFPSGSTRDAMKRLAMTLEKS